MNDWLDKPIDPGPVGDLVEHENKRNRTHLLAILTGIPAAVAACVPVFMVWRSTTWPGSVWTLLGTVIIEVLYLVVAYYVKPRPETSNLGMIGPFFNDPFRFSDNLNRFLLFLLVVLWPGRLVSVGLVDLVKAILPAKVWNRLPVPDPLVARPAGWRQQIKWIRKK